jgi:carbamoyltransferase
MFGVPLKKQISTQGQAAAFLPSGMKAAPSVQDERIEAFAPEEDLPAFLAREIAAGKIVCLHRGESEIGPRALGHRSILAKASSAAVRDRINLIKGRENWRPLAPIVRKADFHRYFSGNPESCRFMLFTYAVISRDVPGITHVDGTARVQTIGDDDALLSPLLQALPAHGEPAVIVNTSFNAAGEPIVETVQHAINTFAKLRADWLVVENKLYRLKSAFAAQSAA